MKNCLDIGVHYRNPVSVVGQHMQQAGATPAEAMAFTLSTAIQYANDCISIGLEPDIFLPRFTFFFDISISFFEEIAKFRAGRRVWAKITKNRFGAKDPRSWRFKFHSQTSGVDLTRQQPLNNIARVTTQAIIGILGGTQSMHTDAYDEALCTPTEAASRIAVNTQNILREEARLADVIDPLAGSYYLETLVGQMEDKILQLIEKIDNWGGMYQAVQDGLIQTMIGRSSLKFQEKIETGEQKIVGVNAYVVNENIKARQPKIERPDIKAIKRQIERHKAFKKNRSQAAVESALNNLSRAANQSKSNLFEKIIAAAKAGVTHGEICACIRAELGFGQPLVAA